MTPSGVTAFARQTSALSPVMLPISSLSRLVENIELGKQWLEEVRANISLKGEVNRVKKEGLALQERLLL